MKQNRKQQIKSQRLIDFVSAAVRLCVFAPLQAATSPPSAWTLRSGQWTSRASGWSCRSGTRRVRRDSEPSHPRESNQTDQIGPFRAFIVAGPPLSSLFFLFLCAATTGTPTASSSFTTSPIPSPLWTSSVGWTRSRRTATASVKSWVSFRRLTLSKIGLFSASPVSFWSGLLCRRVCFGLSA